MRAALLLAALALVVPGLPATAPASAVPVLTVTGTRSASALFTVTAPVSFDYDRAVVSGTGSYVGVVVYAADHRPYGGMAVLPRLTDGHRPLASEHPSPLGGPRVALPPGRYRLYLLTDAPVEVRFPLTSGLGLTVAATAPLRAAVSVQRHVFGPEETSAALRQPLTARGRTRTFVLGRLGDAPGPHTIRVCLATRAWCDERNGTVTTHGGTYVTSYSGLAVNGTTAHRRAARAEATVDAPFAAGTVLGLAALQFDRV